MKLSILRKYQQTSNYTIKNQGQNKNRTITPHSLEFILFTAVLIGPVYFSYLIEQHFMKFWKDEVLQSLGKLI